MGCFSVSMLVISQKESVTRLLSTQVVPGFFTSDAEKYIYGTDPPIQLSTIRKEDFVVNARYQFNYSAPGVQEYCNSNVKLFAEWSVCNRRPRAFRIC